MAIEKTKTCDMCGKHFITRSHNALYCENCRTQAKRSRDERWRQRKKYGMRRIKPISQVMRELEKYNREHKTHLTYGQYVPIMERGDDNE